MFLEMGRGPLVRVRVAYNFLIEDLGIMHQELSAIFSWKISAMSLCVWPMLGRDFATSVCHLAGRGLNCFFHSEIAVPLQCPYSALTVPLQCPL